MWPRVTGACLALLTAFAAGAGTPPPLPAEHLEVARLPVRSPHWVYAYDSSINNETDYRIYLYDGDQHRELGQFDTGYYPGFAISPDHRTTAVATTYFSRGGHGTRTDVVEFWDNTTLALLPGEIALPPKRAQTLPSLYSVNYSADQRFLYVTNLTPAASFSVVDLTKRAVVDEVDTDGCVLVIPSAPRRVSSLCENGRLLTVTLDDTGHEASRQASAPFFNVDKDPIFVQGIPTASGVTFLSFLGDVYAVDLSGAEPAFPARWPIASGAERGRWRPGGTQPGALQERFGRLYVTMHKGGEGTHKVGGTEIWVLDVASRKRIARYPVDTAQHGSIVAVQVSQDERPLLFVATEKPSLLIMDAMTGRLQYVEPKLGQTCCYLINP
jgi:methylamine dehydrogenase heavy chain